MLLVENITLRFHGTAILDDISFKLHKGKILGLIGPNGAGKTSLIRTINGAVAPDSGRIIFKKQDLTQLKPQDRAQLVTTVPQARNIPPGFTVEQIVQMGRTPYLNWFGASTSKDEEFVEKALQKTNIHQMRGLMADEISGGEQQRVILARAIAQDTPLLLLDEPTTHLDIRYQMQFLELLFEHVKEKKTSVIIALHDLNQAVRFCDEVLLLSCGKIFASGKPHKVLSEENLSTVYQYPIKVHAGKKEVPAFIFPEF